MFRQEINLYEAFIIKQGPKTPLTWKRMWACQIGFLVLFTIMALVSSWQVHLLKNKKMASLDKAMQLEQTFYKLKRGYPAEFFNQDVEQSIQKLSQQMLTKQKILANIANRGLFSDNLNALSQSIEPNVWLIQIMIDKSGDTIHLRGKSTNSANLQAFLSHLSSNPIYSHYNLSVKSISENADTEQRGDMLFEIDLTRNAA